VAVPVAVEEAVVTARQLAAPAVLAIRQIHPRLKATMAVAAAQAPINITAAAAAVLLPLVVKALTTPRPVAVAQAVQELRQLFLARPLLMQAAAAVALSTAQVERVVPAAVETAQQNLLRQTQ
jgi:hypothetical protein